jgi:nitrogenase subunit NifH
MIDPVTAIAGATKAFAMVKGMVQAGRSVEDTMGQIASWYGHASDVLYQEQKANKVSPFRKVVFSKSVEAEAIKAFARKKKIQEQQREIMLMIRYAYGDDGLREFRELKRKIVQEREDTVYRQQELKENMLVALFGVVFSIITFGLVSVVVREIKG